MGRTDVTDHNSLIRIAARRTLGPLGLHQKGRSRTWLDDHGWWLVIVEFQSSSWARGTYLNVGAMWLWRSIDHLAFEYGYRVGDFLDAETARDFAAGVDAVADRAASEVHRIRTSLSTPMDMARELLAKPSAGGWDLLHAATASVLAGQLDVARQILQRIAPPISDAPAWQHRFWEEVQTLRGQLMTPDALEARLTAAVQASRAALKLPEWIGSIPFGSRPAA